MKTAYPTFVKENNGDYLVFVPDFEIYTEGTSIADAIEMARDAIGLKGIDMEDCGQTLPNPSNLELAIKKAKEDADDIFDYSTGVLSYVDVDFLEYRKQHDNKMVRRNVTIPCWLNKAADKAKINVSKVLQEALKERLAVK
jgi:predicted RNase H-like HicB family nuclease